MDFNEYPIDRPLPDDWEYQAGKMFVPRTQFIIRAEESASGGRVLSVETNRSTGVMMFMLSDHVDLEKTPILRWRWRVHHLPVNGDGRFAKLDDQPVALYFGAGGALSRRSIGYRWENLTPVGTVWDTSLLGGSVKIEHRCLRNFQTPAGEWVVEERNVAEDFRRKFGYLPKTFVISIGGNSQYTGSVTRAEIDFFEMAPALLPTERMEAKK